MVKITILIILLVQFLSTTVFAPGPSEIGNDGSSNNFIIRFYKEAWNKALGSVAGSEEATSPTWLETVWNDTSILVTDTWNQLFPTPVPVKDIWGWLQDESTEIKAEYEDLLPDMIAALNCTDAEAEDMTRQVLLSLAAKVGISETDELKLWQQIADFAEQKGIDPVLAGKMSMPYMLQLHLENSQQYNLCIPAQVAAQYAIGKMEALCVEDEAACQAFIKQLLLMLSAL